MKDSTPPSPPAWLQKARSHWQHSGTRRPDFARTPGPGEESVWDYPRPPALVDDSREVVVRVHGVEIARSRRARRILETASPPTFYLPPEDVRRDLLIPAPGQSFCEWKGPASYWTVAVDDTRIESAAWTYPKPFGEFAGIAGWYAFYPGKVDCLVDGQQVRPQAGGFYGGWVTDEIIGPYKGEPGTGGW